MTDDNKSTTWKATVIGAVMALASSAAGYVSSHWGGVTVESAAKDKAELIAKIESSSASAAAKVEDSMRKYVDEKFDSVPVYQPPKRKGRRGE